MVYKNNYKKESKRCKVTILLESVSYLTANCLNIYLLVLTALILAGVRLKGCIPEKTGPIIYTYINLGIKTVIRLTET